MSLQKKQWGTFSAVLICIIFLVGITGCEKLSFLEKYFPSLFKNKQTASEPATPAKKEPVMTPTTLARVGNWTITIDEFNQKLKSLKDLFPKYNVDTPESKKTILEELIRQQLLIEEAQRTGLSKDKDIVQAVDEFRRTLLVQELAARITEKIKVTEDEARAFYNQNKDSFGGATEYKIREIVVATQKEANDIIIQIYQGVDFAAIAQAKSIAESAKAGGDLGYISEFPFARMKSAVEILEPGETSSVFKGDAGYYIVKLEDKRKADTQSFTDIKDDIINGLTLMKQQQAMLDYIDKLRAKTKIEINDKLLGE